MLEIRDLCVSSEEKEILKGVSLKIKPGEIHALMGPNGSGKSSLALALAGHPRYQIARGRLLLDNKDVTKLPPDKRARLGLFLALQHPVAVPGVSVVNFLKTASRDLKNERTATTGFIGDLREKMKALRLDESFASRGVNDGFSGGEKKKSEVLQLAILKPKYAVLDETDSGLDIDALKLVANNISRIANRQPTKGDKRQATSDKPGILLITHYQRILKYIKPDQVHVLVGGEIVKSGDYKLAELVEEEGYTKISNAK